MINKSPRPPVRMLDWLLVTLVLTLIIALVAPHLLKVTLYKLSLITLGGVLGYWLDRGCFPYARPDAPAIGWDTGAAMLRRAIIVAACVIGVALGT